MEQLYQKNLSHQNILLFLRLEWGTCQSAQALLCTAFQFCIIRPECNKACLRILLFSLTCSFPAGSGGAPVIAAPSPNSMNLLMQPGSGSSAFQSVQHHAKPMLTGTVTFQHKFT